MGYGHVIATLKARVYILEIENEELKHLASKGGNYPVLVTPFSKEENMAKIKGYQMDMEERKNFPEPEEPTTKTITVTTNYTYSYKVDSKFDMYDDLALNSLLANGSPVEEGPSGDIQIVSDLSIERSRSYSFE